MNDIYDPQESLNAFRGLMNGCVLSLVIYALIGFLLYLVIASLF